jgi:carboxymethylenebutenolidase
MRVARGNALAEIPTAEVTSMKPSDHVDEAGKESFPASDPPAVSSANHSRSPVQRAWQHDARKSLEVTTSDGTFLAYVDRPDKLPAPAVVVLHEIFGVNEDMRATCAELADAGFIAVCPELFWRQERGVDLSVTAASDWEKGIQLYQAFDLDAGVRDVKATLDATRGLPDCSGKVAVMGYCLGGLLTFLAAARSNVDAGVAWHGGRTEEFLAEAGNIRAPLLMHLAEADEFIPMQAQQQIKDALANKPGVEIHSYPGCRHAFARHGGTHYNADAARTANARTIEFLRRQLK